MAENGFKSGGTAEMCISKSDREGASCEMGGPPSTTTGEQITLEQGSSAPGLEVGVQASTVVLLRNKLKKFMLEARGTLGVTSRCQKNNYAWF